MRIAFICASLEQGRDGVGDYCLRLGLEIQRLGHEVLLISVNDRWCLGECAELKAGMPVLRYGPSTPINQRLEMASKALLDFAPDWVSLQYVCFGYHPRGLGWRWNSLFARLGRLARHRHLMLHELWIGSPPAHRRLIGWGQQWVVRQLHRRFRPDLVTTSITAYQQRLACIGINARVLVLIGNIPVVARDDDRIGRLLCASGSRWAQQPRSTFLNGVVFGTVHPDFAVGPFLKWVAQLQSQTGKPLLLTLIGRTGKAAEPLARLIVQSNPELIEVISLDEQPEEIISQALQFADFGISTATAIMLGKSGTFAAMQEHGLPVVLADGELDAAIRQNNAPPVMQFTTSNSITEVMKPRRIGLANPGVMRVATDLIRLYESELV